MRDLANALMKLTWQMPLSGAEQTAKLMSKPVTGVLGRAGGSLGMLAEAVENQVVNFFRATKQAAENVQKETVETFFDAVTLKPVVEAFQQNFSFLGPEPQIGSQKQPELEYLRAINDAGPAGSSLNVISLGILYASLGRAAEGIPVFEGYLREYDGVMRLWQRGVYLSVLALLQASRAQETPIWKIVTVLELGREALATARRAKEVTAPLPDYEPQTAKITAYWVSGLLNAQLPPPLGDRNVAETDLRFVEATIMATPERQAKSFTFLRETFFQLARIAKAKGDTVEAERLLRLSTYKTFEQPDTILATIFSGSPAGLRDGIKHVLVSGGGRVFTVSGQDMSEFNFVISQDGKHLIAIDSGTRFQRSRAAYDYLLGYFKTLGITAPPLTTAIFTHAHWDHIGGHTTYREINPNVKFYSRYNFHPEQERIVHLPPPYSWFLSTQFDLGNVANYRPDFVITPDQGIVPFASAPTSSPAEAFGKFKESRLTVGGTELVFKLEPMGGGETPDGLLAHLPREKVVFAGDFIVPWIGSPYNQEGNVPSLLETIEWISSVEPEIILYGHEALTVFFNPWQTLQQIRPHLDWLREATREMIFAHKTRVEIQEANLFPQAILAADQAPVQLPYLLMRESVINRIFLETAGYWGPQLTNVDYLTPREFGSIFSRYLKLSPNQIAETVNDMVTNGDLELAGQLADWAFTQYPGDATLRRAQELAFRKLKEKWQLMNVFKFIMYGEHIDNPTDQLPIGERPQGYSVSGEPGSDVGNSNAGFSARRGSRTSPKNPRLPG